IAEPGVSVTGASADDRYAMPASHVTDLAIEIATAITGNGTPDTEMGRTIAADLQAHRGRALVMAGRSQPAAVHAACAAINEALGNTGSTVRYARVAEPEMKTASMTALVSDMKAGSVDTLVALGGNPVWDAPADLDFLQATAKVANTIHFGTQDDETSAACRWHLIAGHPLETWGDGRAWNGTISIQQPMIRPLWNGRSTIELLALLAGEKTVDGLEIVRRTWEETTGAAVTPAGEEPPFDSNWRKALHDGVVEPPPVLESPRVDLAAVNTALAAAAKQSTGDLASGGIEVNFMPGVLLGGRMGNNGWMQELPDPITKLAWDNAVLISGKTAGELGVTSGDVVTVEVGKAGVKGAVLVQPGQSDGTVSIALGYGRDWPGRVASGAGFNAYPIRTSDRLWANPTGRVKKSGGAEQLITTQDHYAIDTVGGIGTQQRLPVLFREASAEWFKSHPNFARDRDHTISSLSLWDETQFEGANYRWGMTTDLSKCTGCSACITACQAENNIPIVGKDQVRMGREMHWLRIDRYYRFRKDRDGFDTSQPASIAMQPMTCQHCENAPCEQVCPVAATVHTTDGLNSMVYNRCVGTRYCANNCPYKVRRFNFFDYFRRDPLRETGMLQVQGDYYTKKQSGGDPLRQMQFNPDVTVRMRGVMEKCTFCTQRIESAKIAARNAWVKMPEAAKAKAKRVVIPDGTITPACAQTCPTGALVFGDLMDETSRVAKLQADHRSYDLLGELNIKPRNRFLARITNPVGGERFPDDFKAHDDDRDHDHEHEHNTGESHHEVHDG
ncbi:MAG: 4Fe-4S dicluster domain-containing protein, partial [Phycisphaerales bacterium]|nr:4Fe-4S dicluster domain-containing protein [Phycisphaerales bacterium]